MRQEALIRRMGRRETHSSRAALAVVSGAVLLAVVLWLILEGVLSMTGNGPLLLAPAQLMHALAVMGTATVPATLLMAGLVIGLLGLLLVAAAVLPGGKPRHILAHPRSAVVVERDVLASAIARTARTAARLAPAQVTATVGSRTAQLKLHPSSGMPVDLDTVREAVDKELSGYSLARPLTPTVSVAVHGAVGV